MIKKILFIILIIVSISVSFATDKIRIGIDYNKNINSINLSAQDDFSVSLNGQIIYNLNSSKINIKKSNNFHLKLHEKFDTLEDALVYIDLYKNKGYESFLHYTDAYEVYIGNFASESEMKSIGQQIKGTSYIYPKGTEIIVKSNNQTIFSYNSETNMDFNSNSIINYNGNAYRGGFRLKRYPTSDLTVINYIDLEEYLYGVVPKEMPAEWDLEALKAQAIAARNFAVMHLGDYDSIGFDLTDDINSQVYAGVSAEKSKSTQAVNETSELLLKYGDYVVAAYYHSNSGGQTESIENVWQAEVPYLKGIKDEFSENVRNSTWEKTYTLSQISLQLNNKGYDVGRIYDVVPVSISENNRIMELLFKGTRQNIVLEKGETRRIFGYFDIKSMWFDVVKDNDIHIVNSTKYFTDSITSQKIITATGVKELSSYNTYQVYNGEVTRDLKTSISEVTFRGKGFGHGIGMSQWGAKVMAERGYTYKDILQHYYTGTYLDRRQ